MRCSTCDANAATDDNFCRRCGSLLRHSARNLRLPVRRPPSQLPAVWRQAAPVVVRGAALVVAGIAAEWLVRSAARKAISLPFGDTTKSGIRRALANRRRRGSTEDTVAISETVLIRRMLLRR